MKIRTGDMVEVIAGKDSSYFDNDGNKVRTIAKVIKVDRDTNKAVVEGVNRVWKHIRPSQKNPQGGRLHKEMPIAISNLLFVCQSCGESTRLGLRVLEGGSKERFCKKCGASNGTISPGKQDKKKS